MARCPNCGRETKRTEDWSCQWCGYPLLSGSYKKIPKTYRELREERLPQQPVVEEAELAPVLEPEPVVEEAEPETELVLEVVPEPISEPEAAAKPKPRTKRKTVAKSKTAPKSKATTEPKSATRLKTAAKAKSVPEAEPEPPPAAMELTVEELLSAYEAEGAAADAKFANKILKVTGIVGRIEVKDTLDINYITLTGAETNLLQNVRCTFDKKHGSELNQLTLGQIVTVQGKYDGSIIDISLRDCVLAR